MLRLLRLAALGLAACGAPALWTSATDAGGACTSSPDPHCGALECLGCDGRSAACQHICAEGGCTACVNGRTQRVAVDCEPCPGVAEDAGIPDGGDGGH